MTRLVSFRLQHAWTRLRALAVASTLLAAGALSAHAATTGRIQGRVVGSDTGEPIGFADVLLVPADTTLRKVGGLTNADGTFLLEAAAGRYELQVRALSYGRRTVAGLVLEAGRLLPLSVALSPEAIRQQEIVVEAKARQNTETSMLAARHRAVALGDAVSAEQVRRSPDKDAAEVLRRVTGLSVSDGKYVFVRGLGERYSSTEVDGVRIASPEQNKRVVPLDLVPASLLENIVVQKTYTADRPGEFGGGDVQVHTKDFPGIRTWAFSVSQGELAGVTFHERHTYAGGYNDGISFGAGARKIPDAVHEIAGNQKLVEGPFSRATLATIARSFSGVWSPRAANTPPNGSYSATYGDELKLFGRPLGLVESWSFARSFDRRQESQRLYRASDTLYDYATDRHVTAAQLGGISGLSYRLSPRHSFHLRGLYTNDATDEVRTYEGPDHTRFESTTGLPLAHRGTRLLYVERNVLSGTAEGRHEIPRLLGLNLDWAITRSQARRLQPDRREVVYDRRYYYEGDTAHWVIGSQGSREYGDLRDDGHGETIAATLPYRLGRLGAGKARFGYDHQSKRRDNFYRRFDFIHNSDPSTWESPPDTLFDPATFDGSPTGGYVTEKTYNDAHFTDNYRATQRVEAGYLSLDVPLGSRVRGNLGVRVENGYQDVQSFDLFAPANILQEGRLQNTDWLPSGNFTWAVTPVLNVRAAASRTLSRPDLNELSPSPSLEYEGGSLVLGNPALRRARIDNYDLRGELFPTLTEVFAAGVFYKQLHDPIEQVIRGSADPLVFPENSAAGHNLGLELEARSNLGRFTKRLDRVALNTNASFISSQVTLGPNSKNGSDRHPLQGQANYLLNASLGYASADNRAEAAVLLSVTGRRLKALGYLPLPDIYEAPITSLDATAGFATIGRGRVKIAVRNLVDASIRQTQGPREVSSYRRGRSYSVAFSIAS